MFNTVILPNGVRLVMESMASVRSVAFGIWVKNGSRNENEQNMGISHFIEHMLFKGTETRSATDIAEEMDTIGGQINAFTSKEYTCYHTLVLDIHFDKALEVLSDMFFNSKFDDKEIKKELNVILEEISMYEDSPEDLVHDLLQEQVWQDDSLGYPILGKESTISALTSRDFKDYCNANYHPSNTIIAIAGNIDFDEITKKILTYFGDFNRQEDYANKGYTTQYKPAFVVKQKEIEQLHLAIAFPGVKIGGESTYDFTVFNTIFGSGMSSRLFQKIREEHGLVYSIYSYNHSFSDTGLFNIYAGLGHSQLNKVVGLIMEEIKKLDIDRITEKQVSKTKEQLKSSYLLSLESSSSRMSNLGKSMLMLNKIKTPDEVVAKVEAVTPEKVYKVYQEMFDFNKLSASLVGNVKGVKLEEVIKNAR